MRKTERAIFNQQSLDCRFFVTNPMRTHRVRAALPGETEHPANNTIVAKFHGFDGKHAEVEYREAQFEFQVGDAEPFAAWLWDRLAGQIARADGGVPAPFEVPAQEMEDARTRLLHPAPVLVSLGGVPTSAAPRASLDRLQTMATFVAFQEQRDAR